MTKLLALLSVLLILAGTWSQGGRVDHASDTRMTRALPLPPMRPKARGMREWSIVGVGDVLLHSPLQRQAARSGFFSLWPEIAPYFQGATMAYANLEGPTAMGLTRQGREVADPGAVFDNRVYTSYPMFNYPPALLGALQDSGVDVVSTANNHALDRRAIGVRRTIAALDARGLAFTGTREDPQTPRPWHITISNDGLTVAWLACTFSTNGIPDREQQVLDCYKDREALIELTRRLANNTSLGAIIITPHWGSEYALAPNPRERKLGRELIDAGATAVLGAHPHVPQPIEIHTAPDGRRGVIAYSLGNFVSGQFHRLHTRAAILVRLRLVGEVGQRATLGCVETVHLEMARQQGNYQVRVLPFEGQTPAIARHLDETFGSSGTEAQVNPGLSCNN